MQHQADLHSPPRPALIRWARQGLSFLQYAVYAWIFSVEVEGANHVPECGGLLVASNHASHLDMGLIKYAMGSAGRDLVSLAAQDYFFEKSLHRWYFSNFTNLLSFNRRANLKESLGAAGQVLKSKRNLLIFPEGTRTQDGRMGVFKSSIGFLVLNYEADVLPVYLKGVFESMPRERLIPRARRLKAIFGPVITAQELRLATAHLRDAEAYRAATELIEAAVRKLGEP